MARKAERQASLGRSATRELRRQQLIDATIEAIARRGFADTKMSDVAAGAGLFNALFFPLLLLAAARTTLPEGVGVFSYDAADLDLAPYAILLLALVWGLFAAQCVLLRRSRTGSTAFGFLGWLAWMTVGFHFAFLMHFLVFSDPGRSLDYLLYESTASASYLLDPDYEHALSKRERDLRDALNELKRFKRTLGGTPTWDAVARLLHELGSDIDHG